MKATRIGLISIASVILAVAFVAPRLHPRRPTVLIIRVEEPDMVSLSRVSIIGFDVVDKRRIEAALLAKFTSRCTEAFEANKLKSPFRVARETGFVIRPYTHLEYEAKDIGLMREETRKKYKEEFSTGRAQGGTVPPERRGVQLTVDGQPRIFLHDSAFIGGFFGWLSLGDVLTHELIHAGGQPRKPGRLGSLRHDLAGYAPYSEIIEACK